MRASSQLPPPPPPRRPAPKPPPRTSICFGDPPAAGTRMARLPDCRGRFPSRRRSASTRSRAARPDAESGRPRRRRRCRPRWRRRASTTAHRSARRTSRSRRAFPFARLATEQFALAAARRRVGDPRAVGRPGRAADATPGIHTRDADIRVRGERVRDELDRRRRPLLGWRRIRMGASAAAPTPASAGSAALSERRRGPSIRSGDSVKALARSADGHAACGSPPVTETACSPPPRWKKNVCPSGLQNPPAPV